MHLTASKPQKTIFAASYPLPDYRYYLFASQVVEFFTYPAKLGRKQSRPKNSVVTFCISLLCSIDEKLVLKIRKKLTTHNVLQLKTFIFNLKSISRNDYYIIG